MEALPSSFAQLLRTIALPCVYKQSAAPAPSQQQQQQGDDVQQELLLLLPRQQLVLSQHLLSFFGSFKLPYLAADVTEPQLLQLIGVTREVTVQVVLQVLVQLATGQHLQLEQHGHIEQCEQQQQQQQQKMLDMQVAGTQQQQQQQLFVTSCEVMGRLYSYLLQQLQLAQQQAEAAAATTTDTQQQQQQHAVHYQQLQQQVQAAFQRYPLVWLPDAINAAAGSTGGCAGRFYHLQQLCLDDPSGVLEELACQQLAATAARAGQQLLSAAIGEADTEAEAAVRLAVLRPVLLHYAAAGQLFSEWLAAAPVAAAGPQHDAAGAAAASTAASAAADNKGCMLREPGMQQFIAALQLLAAEAAERQQHGLPHAHLGRDSAIWTKVSCVLRAACSSLTHLSVVLVATQCISHGLLTRPQLLHLDHAVALLLAAYRIGPPLPLGPQHHTIDCCLSAATAATIAACNYLAEHNINAPAPDVFSLPTFEACTALLCTVADDLCSASAGAALRPAADLTAAAAAAAAGWSRSASLAVVL
jgi:hypothetical protein